MSDESLPPLALSLSKPELRQTLRVRGGAVRQAQGERMGLRCHGSEGWAEHGFTSLRRSAENGFTLIEVMVALMIFGMIAAAGVGLLAFSVRAQAATDARLARVAGVARLSAALSADLAQAMERPARDAAGVARPAFDGGAGVLQLVRGGWANYDGAARPGLQKVAWRLEAGTIVREGWPMLDGAAPLPAAAMLDRVRTLAFRYRIDGAWRESWRGTPQQALPQAVEMTIARDDGVVLRELFYVGGQPRRIALGSEPGG